MSIESIVRTCNKQAMESLCTNNYSECYRLLKKAEEIVRSPSYPTNSKLSAVTWNNLGCYYKRINSYELALEYLNRALKEDVEGDSVTVAGTHLNILAVLSSTKDHKKALYHGVQAIKLLKLSNNYSTLIIALQSTGDEYMALEDTEKAYSTYAHALEIAQEHLGPNSIHYSNLQEKMADISKQEKKFYFEKLNKRATKHIINNYRNNSALPKLAGPIKPSKSFQRSPPAKQRIGKKMRSDRMYMKTAPQKQKMFLNPPRSQAQDDGYMRLEEKINFLQNQLENFEVRYKKLENFARSKTKARFRRPRKLTVDESAVMIQKWWRGYRDRKEYRVYRRKMTFERAKRAIEELKELSSNINSCI